MKNPFLDRNNGTSTRSFVRFLSTLLNSSDSEDNYSETDGETDDNDDDDDDEDDDYDDEDNDEYDYEVERLNPDYNADYW